MTHYQLRAAVLWLLLFSCVFSVVCDEVALLRCGMMMVKPV